MKSSNQMVLSYAYCSVPAMPVRHEPFHRSEQVNQVLFGERMEVLEVNDRDWTRIRSEWDHLEGWCKSGQITHVQRKEYRKQSRVIVSQHGAKFIFSDSEMWLPLGSDLFGTKAGRIVLGEQEGKFKGKKISLKKVELNSGTLVAAAKQYIGAPYQWGGRTIMGIDCSGLVQNTFKLCGKRIFRNSDQQATQGELVDFLQHAQCGDLAFFDNNEGKIVHVGILLDTQHILHASDSNGKVMIDKIDQGGIISVQHKKRTHNLRMVRRYF